MNKRSRTHVIAVGLIAPLLLCACATGTPHDDLKARQTEPAAKPVSADVAPRSDASAPQADTVPSTSVVPLPAATPTVVSAPASARRTSGKSRKTDTADKAQPPLATPADPLLRLVTLEFRDASVRSLFDAISKASGLNVVFDKDIPPDLKTSVYLRNTTVKAALDKIVLTSGLAWRVLDENTLLVYTDETNKQHDYQSLVLRGFQLSNADAKFVANSLKTVLKFRDVVVDEKLNMIIVRDTPESIALAEKLIAMHDVPEPEVMLDVTILEVNKGRLQNLGVAWPNSLSLSPLARTVSNTSSTVNTTSGISSDSTTYTLTLRDLYNLTPGSLAISTPTGTLNFNATDSNVRVLANPSIRAKNREKAKILIGERVPNISASTTSNGVVNQNINYVDVGLKLDVEPQIYPGNEIGLKIALEVSSINSTVENKAAGLVAYRIGTRNASTVLRLKDGENQVLAGLIQDSDKKTVSKVPLLSEIPLLGRLFRSDSTEKDKTEIVLSITPHLVRGNHYLPQTAGSVEAGTFSSVRGRRSDADNAAPAPESVTPQQQVTPSTVDTTQQPQRPRGGSRDD